MPVLVRREVERAAGGFENYRNRKPNPGLVLRRGLSDSGLVAGQAKAALLAGIADIPSPEAYRWAYKRWCKTTTGGRFDARELELEGRLYIGVSRDNPLETGLTVGHAWGMPVIPGSALKGVARHTARSAGVDTETENWLFGSSPPGHEDADLATDGEAAAVVFHDAWWCPVGKPFVAEVVTPHHMEYYAEGKGEATDFDSPIPAPQVAVRGRFRFVVEAPEGWRELAMGLLTRALTQQGVGGKTTSGYGLFKAPA
jgi:CRISPR-associated protein Cmr6